MGVATRSFSPCAFRTSSKRLLRSSASANHGTSPKSSTPSMQERPATSASAAGSASGGAGGGAGGAGGGAGAVRSAPALACFSLFKMPAFTCVRQRLQALPPSAFLIENLLALQSFAVPSSGVQLGSSCSRWQCGQRLAWQRFCFRSFGLSDALRKAFSAISKACFSRSAMAAPYVQAWGQALSCADLDNVTSSGFGGRCQDKSAAFCSRDHPRDAFTLFARDALTRFCGETTQRTLRCRTRSNKAGGAKRCK